MSRKVKETISIEDLTEKIDTALSNYRDLNIPEYRRYKDLTPRIKKDLAKCDFDLENVNTRPNDFGPDGLMGYRTLENELSYLGISAGGDWELPVFFIIYWDGKELRGYIPTKGNPYNTDTKKPYGNSTEALDDGKNIKKRFPGKFKFFTLREIDAMAVENLGWDSEQIKDDIIKRIKIEAQEKTF